MISREQPIQVPENVLESWQEIVDLLAQLLNIPAGLIMRFNDPDIEVLVSSRSDGNPYHHGDKEHLWGSGLYCETVIKSREKLLVPDALADERWKDNPDVKLNMISYLGFPILLPNEEPFGTLCVLDNKANPFSATIETLMQKFRNLIESNLELIYLNQTLGDRNKKIVDYLRELQVLRGLVAICSNCKSIRDTEGNWHPVEHYLIKHPEADFSHGICPKCLERYYSDAG